MAKAVSAANANLPASGRQLWFLKTLTGEDHKDLGLTMQQASDLISGLKAEADARKARTFKLSLEVDSYLVDGKVSINAAVAEMAEQLEAHLNSNKIEWTE